MSKDLLESRSNYYLKWKSDIKKTQIEIENYEKDVNKLIKEMDNLEKRRKKEKDPKNKEQSQKEWNEKSGELENLRDKLKIQRKTLEEMKRALVDRECEIKNDNPELKRYIEYAKAQKYDQLIEKDKLQISKNNRLLSMLEENPELKEKVVRFLEKSDEIKSIEDEIKQDRKDKHSKTADAKVDEKLKPAKSEKDKLEEKIKEYVEDYNKSNIKQINLKELLSTINKLSVLKDEDGKTDIDEAVRKNNEALSKNIDRNETLLKNVVEESYREDKVLLQGFSNYSRPIEKRITEDEYKKVRESEIQAELKEKYGMNLPAKYEKWYKKLLHPIKAHKEKQQREENESIYNNEYSEKIASISEEFKAKLEEAKSIKTVTKEDFNMFSFGKDTKEVIKDWVDKEMKQERKYLEDTAR